MRHYFVLNICPCPECHSENCERATLADDIGNATVVRYYCWACGHHHETTSKAERLPSPVWKSWATCLAA